jgi:hypothetical protein
MSKVSAPNLGEFSPSPPPWNRVSASPTLRHGRQHRGKVITEHIIEKRSGSI